MVVINIKHKNIQIVVITNKINTIPSIVFLDLSNKPHMIGSGFSGSLESLIKLISLLQASIFSFISGSGNTLTPKKVN